MGLSAAIHIKVIATHKAFIGVKNMTASFSNTEQTQQKNLLNVFLVYLPDKN